MTSRADLRPGPDGRGYRRILHPNGVCLTGEWKIDDIPAAEEYTGYFHRRKRALVIARYSTCCSETRGSQPRSSLANVMSGFLRRGSSTGSGL